jgi:hypothetical protein
VNVTRLNLRRLGRHSIDFAPLRFDADRTRHSLRHGGSEILQKVHAGTRILDQDRARAMLRSETDDLAAQFRIFEATPIDMEKVGKVTRWGFQFCQSEAIFSRKASFEADDHRLG